MGKTTAINRRKLDRWLESLAAFNALGMETPMQELHRHIDFLTVEGQKLAPGLSGFRLLDFCRAITGYRGLKPDAANEDIYRALAALGWKVTE